MKASPWILLLASAALAAPPETPKATREATGKGQARDVIRLQGGPARDGSGDEGEEKQDRPPLQPPDTSRKLVKGSPRHAATALTAPAVAALGSVRLQGMTTGEARLLVAGAERTLRPGDRLGSDVVREVGDGVIVLDRPAVPGQPGGEAVVVMRFGASGEPSVRVYHAEDPTPVVAPGVQ